MAGPVQLIDEAAEIARGIATRRTDGHTRGHQIVTFSSRGQTACYLGDLCPMVPHLRTFWSMAYDQFPLTVRTMKPAILGEIADGQHVAMFSHDPQCRIARIRRDADGGSEWTVEPIVR